MKNFIEWKIPRSSNTWRMHRDLEKMFLSAEMWYLQSLQRPSYRSWHSTAFVIDHRFSHTRHEVLPSISESTKKSKEFFSSPPTATGSCASRSSSKSAMIWKKRPVSLSLHSSLLRLGFFNMYRNNVEENQQHQTTENDWTKHVCIEMTRNQRTTERNEKPNCIHF